MADQILSELGYSVHTTNSTSEDGTAVNSSACGTGGRPSLAALFAAANGESLESRRCQTYRLLARQEVRHRGAPLATLLLLVTRPAALLRPVDLASMAPQLCGLVVTSVAPLPPPVITALLRAGVAGVLCPEARMPLPEQPAFSAAADGEVLRSSARAEDPSGVDGDVLAGYFAVVIEELVEGATVLRALKAAEEQHAALAGWVVFHHL